MSSKFSWLFCLAYFVCMVVEGSAIRGFPSGNRSKKNGSKCGTPFRNKACYTAEKEIVDKIFLDLGFDVNYHLESNASNKADFLREFACACAQFLEDEKEIKSRHFAMYNGGQCLILRNDDKALEIRKDLPSDLSKCNEILNDGINTCSLGNFCTGTKKSFFLYELGSSLQVDGGFGEWSAYSECSKSCGGGTQSRTRSCDNPVPSNGGKQCSGSKIQVKGCSTQACPVDGGFGEWSGYSECSKRCDGGIKSRTRSCDNPIPSNGGKQCSGSKIEVKGCSTQACPVDGGFGDWTVYSECSKSCGGGTKYRTRSCDNPAPSNGGKQCSGSKIEVKGCSTQSCPVDGGFGSWSSYSECTKSCGGGTKYRERSCDNPAPKYGGKICSGRNIHFSNCNMEDCKKISPNRSTLNTECHIL